MSYNILDLFSKNFFSVFLAYNILSNIWERAHARFHFL
jgi:hypothetical protein